MVLMGIDGCRGGWLSTLKLGDTFKASISPDIETLVQRLGQPALIGIDIPIGLTEKGRRACDNEARRLLGRPRGSSVFSAPVRGVLNASTHQEASRMHKEIDGRGLSIQCFGILSKIRQVDAYLTQHPASRRWIHEVHPEVSFALWNDGRPMQHKKKSSAGAAERLRLIESRWPGAVTAVTATLKRGEFEKNDVLDAFAALWSIERLSNHQAKIIPDKEVVDSVGLCMEIVA